MKVLLILFLSIVIITFSLYAEDISLFDFNEILNSVVERDSTTDAIKKLSSLKDTSYKDCRLEFQKYSNDTLEIHIYKNVFELGNLPDKNVSGYYFVLLTQVV
jgi:hypothetical protein